MRKMILMVMMLILPLLAFAEDCDSVDVYLPELTVTSNENFTVEVSIPESVDGCNIEGYQFEVHFDPNVVVAEGYDVSQTMSDGMMIVPVIDNENGYIRIGAYGLSPLTGNGTLINLNFTSQGEGTTDLTFQNYRFNSGMPVFVPYDGSVEISDCDPGDVNCDGIITMEDVDLLMLNWGLSSAYDTDGNGFVDMRDIQNVIANLE